MIDREVTASVLWFYINSLYFPYNAQNLAEIPFEDFAAPLFQKLLVTEEKEYETPAAEYGLPGSALDSANNDQPQHDVKLD